MGTFELVQVADEERILICDGNFIHPGENKPRLCGNLLKIKVTLANGSPAQFLVLQEYDTSMTVSNGVGPAPSTKVCTYSVSVRHGACLTSQQRRPYSTRRRYTYGPVNVKFVTFVHCKQCEKRWAWKRFKKLVL